MWKNKLPIQWIFLSILFFAGAFFFPPRVLANCEPGIESADILVGTDTMIIRGCLGTAPEGESPYGGGYVGIVVPSDSSKNTAAVIDSNIGSDGQFEIRVENFPETGANLSLYAFDEYFYENCTSEATCNPQPVGTFTYQEPEGERFEPPPGFPAEQDPFIPDANVDPYEPPGNEAVMGASAGTESDDDDKTLSPFSFCEQIPADSPAYGECGKCGETEVFTALGCVDVDQKSFVNSLVKILLSISGGIALLSLLAAAWNLTISQGDTGKVKEAKDLATAAVGGILFIIFSVIILSFIGVDILQIPGLG